MWWNMCGEKNYQGGASRIANNPKLSQEARERPHHRNFQSNINIS